MKVAGRNPDQLRGARQPLYAYGVRLTNAFSKKLDDHAAAVSRYVAHYNLCRIHEALRTSPAVAQGIADRMWSSGDY